MQVVRECRSPGTPADPLHRVHLNEQHSIWQVLHVSENMYTILIFNILKNEPITLL